MVFPAVQIRKANPSQWRRVRWHRVFSIRVSNFDRIGADMTVRFALSVPTVTVGESVDSSQELVVGDFTSFLVSIPSGSSITSISVYASTDSGVTYLPVYDSSGNQCIVSGITAGRAHQLPLSSFPVRHMKLVGNVAGTVGISMKG